MAESLAHAPRSRFGAEDREREREREERERERRDAQKCSRAVPRVGTNATDGRMRMRSALLEKGECACRSVRLGSARLSRMRRCRFSLLPDRCNRGGWTPPNAEASFSCPRYSLTDYGRLIGDGREFVVQPQLPCRFLFFLPFFSDSSFFSPRWDERKDRRVSLYPRCIFDHSPLARIPKEIHEKRKNINRANERLSAISR